MSQRPGQPSLPNIAVVAVHGVADQAPHSSARAMAGLLLGLFRRGTPGEARSMYTSFREHPFHIPLHPLPISPAPGECGPRRKETQRSATLETALEGGARQNATQRSVAPGRALEGGSEEVGDAAAAERRPVLEARDYQVMRDQLACFEHGKSKYTYDSVRLEGQKLEASGTDQGEDVPAANVHIYEMYWADLSRLGHSAVRVFGELYQLLLNLADVGRQALDFAAAERPSSRTWRWYAWVHERAVRLLTGPIPVLNLALVVLTLGVVPLAMPLGVQRLVITLAGAAAAAVAAGMWIPQAQGKGRPFTWIIVPLGLGAGAAALLRILGDSIGPRWYFVTLAVWIVAGWVALQAVLRAYDRRRPRSLRLGRIIYAAMSIVFAYQVVRAWKGNPAESSHPAAVLAIITTVEVVMIALFASWVSMMALALLTRPLKLLAWREVRAAMGARNATREWVRVRRATRVAAATLALPAFLLIVLSLTLWSGLYAAGSRAIPECAIEIEVNPALARHFRDLAAMRASDRKAGPVCEVPEGRVDAKIYVQEMITLSGGHGFVPMLLLSGLAVLIALWAIGPVVWTEVRPPRIDFARDGDPDRRADTRIDAIREGHHARRLGEWLSVGLHAMPFAGWLLFYGIFVMVPLGIVVAFTTWTPPFFRIDWTREVMLTAGAWIAASAVGILALRGRLDVLALGFRPAIDIALDVESYLRHHPRNHTPRARIVERYTSLLRYLCRWRTPDERPYDAIVVVAHSQGTVITADLLGFLQREMRRSDGGVPPDDDLRQLGLSHPANPASEGIPLYLFTMGSPLRQLYGAAFPHQYAWVEGRDDAVQDLASIARPDPPSALGPLLPSDAAGALHVSSDEVIPDDASPDPWAIGASRWINAYRSGDYVGRSLWRKAEAGGESRYLHRRSCIGVEEFDPPGAMETAYYLLASEDRRKSRRELCIGAGAHTHYWDTTAHDIAIELDMLIDDGIALASRRAEERSARRQAPINPEE